MAIPKKNGFNNMFKSLKDILKNEIVIHVQVI